MNLWLARQQIKAGGLSLELSLPHALIEAKKDGLTTDDLVKAVMVGEVVEDYGERILLLHFATDYRIPFHVVLEWIEGDSIATVVTAYVPGSDRWKADWKSRKKTPTKKQKKKKL